MTTMTVAVGLSVGLVGADIVHLVHPVRDGDLRLGGMMIAGPPPTGTVRVLGIPDHIHEHHRASVGLPTLTYQINAATTSSGGMLA